MRRGAGIQPSGGGGSATTSASDLTSGTLAVARLADGSITDAKLTGVTITSAEKTRLAGVATAATANRADSATDTAISGAVSAEATIARAAESANATAITANATAVATREHSYAEEHGFKAISMDPATASQASIVAAGGTGYFVRLWLPTSQSISEVDVVVSTQGSGLSNVGFALYSGAGALLTSSVNANGATTTAFGATGIKPVTFTPQTISAGYFYVLFWFTGTTLPTMTRGATGANVHSLGLSSPNLRIGAVPGTGLTTSPPADLLTQNTGGIAWLIAAK